MHLSFAQMEGTLDGIYLQYTNSHQGGHKILHLQTNKIVTRKTITKLPITSNSINQVSPIAIQKRMLRGLKIMAHNNMTLYNSTLLAGVDESNNEKDNQI